jgi:hypothetical protein
LFEFPGLVYHLLISLIRQVQKNIRVAWGIEPAPAGQITSPERLEPLAVACQILFPFARTISPKLIHTCGIAIHPYPERIAPHRRSSNIHRVGRLSPTLCASHLDPYGHTKVSTIMP